MGTLFVFFMALAVLAQQRDITGTVTDASDGSTLPGVNITVKGTSLGVVSDVNGKYSISVAGNNAVLEFSFVGYAVQEVPVGARSVIDVKLTSEATGLEEVVVTALGIKREKKSLGYSVTEVKGADLVESRDANFVNSLSGKVAGVNVSAPSTGAGGSSRVIIRGATSFSGNNQPLYVIDGVPIDNTVQSQAGKWGGQDWGDAISSINPDDIETMSVLKGNTAAALYGSRASNGVILITTKSGSGKKQGMGIEINSNITFDMAVQMSDPQYEYGQGSYGKRPASQSEALAFRSNWGEKLDGTNTVQFDGVSRPYSAQKDNFKDFYRTGFTATNTVSFFQNKENLHYRLSMSNLDNKGIIESSSLYRKTFTANVGGKHGKFTTEAKVMYIKEKVNNRPRLSDSPGNANYAAEFLPTNLNINDLKPGYYEKDVFDTNGNLVHKMGDEMLWGDNPYVQNPWFAANRFGTKDEKERIIGSIQIKYDILDWLFLRGRIGTDYYALLTSNLEPTGTGYINKGKMQRHERNYWETNSDLMLNATKKFGDIGLNAFVGVASTYSKHERLSLEGRDFVIPFLYAPKNQATQSYNHDFNEKQTNSVFGQVEVSWRSMMYLTFTGRNDWFSTLPVDDNNLFYPSVSYSFIFTEMLKDNLPEFFNYGKFRASWAQVSGGASPYQLYLTYQTTGQGHNGQPMNSITQNFVPNSNLKPYQSTEWEIGTDLRFFNNKLGIDLTYYSRKTEDDIMRAPISKTSGYNSAVFNIGELENSGFEVLLTGTAFENNDWKVDLSLNFSKNNSEVKMLGSEEAKDLEVTQSRNGKGRIHHVVGEPFGSIMGWKYKRDSNGQIVHDSEGLPMQGEYEVLGNGSHDTNLGFSGNIRYKDFSLRFLIDSKFGGDIYSSTNAYMTSGGFHKNTLDGRENGITGIGVNESGGKNSVVVTPDKLQDYYGRIASISEDFVYDASFVKLREISVGYTLPKKITDKLKMTSATVSLVGRNLWLMWSKVDNIDPESNYSSGNGQGLETNGLPPVRTFGFNINMKF